MSSHLSIDPKLLAAVDDLSLLARTVVEGFLSGLHRSPFLGYSTEFASYRPYVQGDNLRYVDWKVWGRSDQLNVKQFEDSTNLTVQIILDTSGSMDFGNPSKFAYARLLAAALAFLMVRQHDAPGLTLLGEHAVQALPPRSQQHHLDDLFQLLAGARAGGHTVLGPELWKVVETFTRRGLAVVISDLFSPGEGFFELLRQLHVQRQETIVFQVLAPEEVDFDFPGNHLMVDSETGREIPLHAGAFRREYQRRLAAFCDRVQEECVRREIDYLRIRTDEPLEGVLTAYLEQRMAV